MDTDVAVIGAGPHGLAAAVHLRRAGVQAQVFGDPLSFWRSMPTGMKLRSNLRATNMLEPAGPFSLESYAAATGVQVNHPVPLSQFIEYGLWVQRNAVADVHNAVVTRLERLPGGFSLELTDGARAYARRVVVACGIGPFAHVPRAFRELPSALVSHTGEHSDLVTFSGRRVAVVGGGQSALECAALMQEAGAEVEALVRGRHVVYLRRITPISLMGRPGRVVYAPTDVGPLWYSRLVSVPALFCRLPRSTQNRIAARSVRPACSHFVRVRLGEVKLSLGVEVRSAESAGDGLRVELSDGTEREIDHLMFGTGYRVDVARYGFMSDEILGDLRRVGDYPVLRRGLESSVEGLHIVGAPAAWSFGPIMRFVSGSWYAGKAVARVIGESRSPQPSLHVARVQPA